jgi:Putative peptidoglycan binding domain
MSIRACVVFCLAACASQPAPVATATTDFVVVQQGRRAWPIQDQALVRNLQERLEAQGFDPGRLDGVADERTGQALAAFQRARGLNPSGVLDEDTANALGLRWKRVRETVRAGRLEPVL